MCVANVMAYIRTELEVKVPSGSAPCIEEGNGGGGLLVGEGDAVQHTHIIRSETARTDTDSDSEITYVHPGLESGTARGAHHPSPGQSPGAWAGDDGDPDRTPSWRSISLPCARRGARMALFSGTSVA